MLFASLYEKTTHVRTKTRFTLSLVHSSSHLVFLQHLIFVRFMSFSKKYLTNRETFTLCRSKKEGEDEMRREGFFHVNKWLTRERRLEATTGNTFAFAGLKTSYHIKTGNPNNRKLISMVSWQFSVFFLRQCLTDFLYSRSAVTVFPSGILIKNFRMSYTLPHTSHWLTGHKSKTNTWCSRLRFTIVHKVDQERMLSGMFMKPVRLLC